MTIKETFKSSGFTIVELLVVIVVIGVLAAITIISYTGVSKKATIASQQSDLTGASRQLEMYKVDNGSYPATLDGNKCPLTPVADTKRCLKSSSGNTYTYTPEAGSYPQAYSLDATNNNNNSTNYRITNTSPPALFALSSNTAPGAPTGLAGSATLSFSTNLNWSAPSDNGGSAITGYKIYSGLTSGSETYLVTTANTLTYSDTGLTGCTEYFYVVKAVNIIGDSVFSNEISISVSNGGNPCPDLGGP
ncbi:MAG: fibronectin type III domain-containing protein [Candidatus Saccharibacteria bacterium]